MSAIELIFGLFGALFMLVVFVAISFVISRFSIKFFEKRTNQIWLSNTQTPQISIFTRLFLKLSYMVYYLYVTTICLILSFGFLSRSGKTYDLDLAENIIDNFFKMIKHSFPLFGDFGLYVYMFVGVLFLPFFIKALYYYKHTGFKFLRVYIIVAFVYYALWCFLLISSLATLAYENFNPQKLEQLKEAFSAFF